MLTKHNLQEVKLIDKRGRTKATNHSTPTYLMLNLFSTICGFSSKWHRRSKECSGQNGLFFYDPCVPIWHTFQPRRNLKFQVIRKKYMFITLTIGESQNAPSYAKPKHYFKKTLTPKRVSRTQINLLHLVYINNEPIRADFYYTPNNRC